MDSQDMFRLHDDERSRAERLHSAVPHIFELAEEAVDRVREFVVQSWQPDEPEPLRFVVPTVSNNVANTVFDLLSSALSRRGRAALSHARNLYELAVVSIELADKSARGDIADRFVAHNAAGAVLFAHLDLPLKYTRGTRLKSARHHMRAVGRDFRPALADAITKYGSAFPRDWAGQSLYEGASKVGLAEHYDLYRFASGFVHGSMVSTFGTYAPTSGAPILRLGPALLPIPLAFAYGITFASDALGAVGSAFGVPVHSDCVSSLQRMLKATDDLAMAIEKIDDSTWPRSQPQGMVAVLLVSPETNLRRWMVHIPDLNLIADADPPALSNDVEESIESKLAELAGVEPSAIATSLTGWVSIGIQDVPIQKRSGAKWQPANLFLFEHASGYGWLR